MLLRPQSLTEDIVFSNRAAWARKSGVCVDSVVAKESQRAITLRRRCTAAYRTWPDAICYGAQKMCYRIFQSESIKHKPDAVRRYPTPCLSDGRFDPRHPAFTSECKQVLKAFSQQFAISPLSRFQRASPAFENSYGETIPSRCANAFPGADKRHQDVPVRSDRLTHRPTG